MRDKTGIQADGEELATLSTGKARQTLPALQALQMIQDIQNKWQEARPKMNEPGTVLTDKVIALCEVLLDLVNEEAQVRAAQKHQINDMIIAIAAESDQDFNIPGRTGLAAIHLATFLNGCRAKAS